MNSKHRSFLNKIFLIRKKAVFSDLQEKRKVYSLYIMANLTLCFFYFIAKGREIQEKCEIYLHPC
ncbi:MAG: hypothetical protein DBY04_04580 [Clostridiales bacterium]|nr:MAG: hypothetical protein DBY04_04580 [Clostridiales bacterium]